MNAINETLDVDILDVDTKIKENFSSERDLLEDYKKRLQNIQKTLSLTTLRPRLRQQLEESEKELTDYIEDLETHRSFNFYILESADLLEKYKEILKLPIKVSFMGKATINNKEKKQIITKYLELANKYVDVNISLEKKERIICKNCNNTKEFDIEDGTTYICLICSAQQYIMKNISSYKDIDRVNISSKYFYCKKVHFRDAINQYQAKQNATIHQKVYDDLENQFQLHHLLIGDKDTTDKFTRFQNVTKEHIHLFLKELGYAKHYENIHLIHYNLTGVKPNNISHLEDKLLEDFDILTEVYDRKFKNTLERKNFIHTQYILYQLLLRHKHPCKKEDFSILKTIDRQNFHDEITSQLFAEIGWSFHSVFF